MVDIIKGVDGVDLDPIDEGEQTQTVDDDDGHYVAITVDGQTLEPVHVKDYGADSFGSHTTMTDGCGNRRVREGGGTGFQLTVEGILTLEQLRTAREMELSEGQRVTIDIEPWTESYVLKTFSWDKPNDLNNWYSPTFPLGVSAYTFQLQTKDPTSESA